MSRAYLQGRTALVLGGSRGIGRAAAVAIARAGATVAIGARSMQDLETTVDEIESLNGSSLAIECDVRNISDIDRAVRETTATFGGLDIAVISVGISPYSTPSVEVTRAEWDEVIATNLTGNFFAMTRTARHMLAHNGGTIIVISSVTAIVGTPKAAAYTAGKSALEGLVRSLAVEWAPNGVRVVGVAPGYIATDLTDELRKNGRAANRVIEKIPMGRFGSTEEIATTISHLADPANSYMTGETVRIDGGMSS